MVMRCFGCLFSEGIQWHSKSYFARNEWLHWRRNEGFISKKWDATYFMRFWPSYIDSGNGIVSSIATIWYEGEVKCFYMYCDYAFIWTYDWDGNICYTSNHYVFHETNSKTSRTNLWFVNDLWSRHIFYSFWATTVYLS